ncbi:S9 family peptidase [Phenylobacterium sp. J426]|uniref:alpha/beta hydrolase family protein n=1 Tax=Phenylobacterium sp. J426 TaxID=2898439 RepID=UPI002150B806|nr:S9 family peptidase [Phenylobacterium sp. J426]MCR5873918.1 S9 family peptidase [Phenylobacterium sp. J426]
MSISRRAVVAAAAAAPVVASWTAPEAAGAQAAIKPHTLDELFREPVVIDAAISPDGEHLAVLRREKRDDADAAFVYISRLKDLEAAPLRIPIGPQQVDMVEWGNNERLLIWLSIWADTRGNPYFMPVGNYLVRYPVRRVIAVGLDGKDATVLFSENRSVLRRAFNAATVVDWLHDDARAVLMQSWDTRRNSAALYKVDLYSGVATQVETGSSLTDAWFTQKGEPLLRMDSNRRGTVVSIFGRAPGEKDWKLIRRARRNELDKLPDFDVLGPSSEAGKFLVVMRPGGENFRIARTFDVRTFEFGDLPGGRLAGDVDGSLIDDKLDLVALTTQGDRLEYHFTDPTLATRLQSVDKATKGRVNLQVYDLSSDRKRVLIKTSGPQEPGAYLLYDSEGRRLHMVATLQPWLEPERLAPMETLRLKTRDGLEITAYLTTPAGPATGPLPMVAMPHGGPERRDSYQFDPFVQALAAKGWLVLQPNFRGSGGYGRAFAAMGHGHWGDKMQDDVEDAVAFVTGKGLADPKRLAICGASYGGYASLMGAVKRPELYRCVVSIAGDADLIEMLKTEREDGEDSPSYQYWSTQVGDPKVHLARLQHSSPRLRAAEFAAPVLLIHGSNDPIVAPKQSALMAEALKKAGKPVEHVELPGVGHSNWSAETWKTIIEKTTDFIAKHI